MLLYYFHAGAAELPLRFIADIFIFLFYDYAAAALMRHDYAPPMALSR